MKPPRRQERRARQARIKRDFDLGSLNFELDVYLNAHLRPGTKNDVPSSCYFLGVLGALSVLAVSFARQRFTGTLTQTTLTPATPASIL